MSPANTHTASAAETALHPEDYTHGMRVLGTWGRDSGVLWENSDGEIRLSWDGDSGPELAGFDAEEFLLSWHGRTSRAAADRCAKREREYGATTYTITIVLRTREVGASELLGLATEFGDELAADYQGTHDDSACCVSEE